VAIATLRVKILNFWYQQYNDNPSIKDCRSEKRKDKYLSRAFLFFDLAFCRRK